MADHNELGKIGEQIAANYLLERGYEILERNFYFDKAEIDLIALKGKTLAIVEVKTRNSDLFGNPQDFITKRKIKRLVKAANEFVISNDLDIDVRFDVIAVLKNESKEQVEHFKDAFYHF